MSLPTTVNCLSMGETSGLYNSLIIKFVSSLLEETNFFILEFQAIQLFQSKLLKGDIKNGTIKNK